MQPNKKVTTILLLTSMSLALTVGLSYAQLSPNQPGQRPQRGRFFKNPVFQNGVRVDVEPPAPPELVLPDNSALPTLSLKLKDKAQVEQVVLPSVNVKSKVATKRSFGDIQKEHPDVKFHLISPGRQVWELKTVYAILGGLAVGRLKDATETLVFDAETGKLLFNKVTGTPIDPPNPFYMPNPPRYGPFKPK